MLNFLYAFDKNYSTQGFTSIYSLLEKVEEQINISLLLDSSSFDQEIPIKIKSHKNLNLLRKNLINADEYFYNLEDSHVSKATFYRLFINEKIKISSEYLIYLDCDVICLENPCEILNNKINQMKINKHPFAMVDELYRHQYDEPFKRLSMNSNKYFNAGFMIIDIKHWESEQLSSKSIHKINTLKNKAKFWDQDILNSLIDGNYLSLESGLNFKSAEKSDNFNNLYFLHFSGKTKPWEVGGYFEKFAIVYHENFSALYNKEFHIICKNIKNSILKLNHALFSNKLTFKSARYIYFSFVTIIKKLL